MAEKSAEAQTFAPRLSIVEDQAQWLIDNRGEGGGTTDEALWKATLTGAEASAGWGDEPWTATDLIYGPDSPNELSLHQTVFGTDSAGALRCQDGKGLYGWTYPVNETRWQNGPGQSGAHLANEVFGLPDSGYVHSLRAAGLHLMAAVFKTVDYVGEYTIIDRILDITEELESLATNVETAVGDLDASIDGRIDAKVSAAVGTQLEDMQEVLDEQFAGLDSLGLGPLPSIIDHILIRLNQLEVE